MGKTIYVNGTLLIRTSEFKYHAEDACLCEIPEDAIIVEPNEIVDGTPCYTIDDINSISIFDTFKASSGFTSLELGSYYYNSDYQDAYKNYLIQREELISFTESIEDTNLNKAFAYKLIFMNLMTLLDSFVCELYISMVTSNEEMFREKLNSAKTDKKYIDYLKKYGPNEERAFIYFIRDKSYINPITINKKVRAVSDVNYDIIPTDSPIEVWIKLRHDVAHNNARKIDGNFYRFSNEEIMNAFKNVDHLIKKIMGVIEQTHGTEKEFHDTRRNAPL